MSTMILSQTYIIKTADENTLSFINLESRGGANTDQGTIGVVYIS